MGCVLSIYKAGFSTQKEGEQKGKAGEEEDGQECARREEKSEKCIAH